MTGEGRDRAAGTGLSAPWGRRARTLPSPSSKAVGVGAQNAPTGPESTVAPGEREWRPSSLRDLAAHRDKECFPLWL